MKRVLVIAPHPDDEAIGCGGTIRRHVDQGDHVSVIFLTSGEHGCRGRDPAETARAREAEAEAAGSILGAAEIEFWHQADGAVAASEALVERLRSKLSVWQPAFIYLPHEAEAHPDHRAATQLVAAALDGAQPGPTIRTYEVWTPLQEIEHVEDISDQIDRKLAAIRAHKSQCEMMRFDEAAEALARYRGEMHSWPGGPYAEVFGKLRV